MPPGGGRGPAPEGAGGGDAGDHCRDGSGAGGLCVLRPGDAGTGCQAVRSAGVHGPARAAGGFVSQNGACGDGMFIVQTQHKTAH